MSYDDFENTPYDLDHDGHIDTNEAAYIHDTLYGEEDSISNIEAYSIIDSDSSDDDDFTADISASRGDSRAAGKSNIKNSKYRKYDKKALEELRKEVKRDEWKKLCIVAAIMSLIVEFIGGHFLLGVILAVIFVGIAISLNKK